MHPTSRPKISMVFIGVRGFVRSMVELRPAKNIKVCHSPLRDKMVESPQRDLTREELRSRRSGRPRESRRRSG
jgi:uncharacterized membrane protein (UPF0127 family)